MGAEAPCGRHLQSYGSKALKKQESGMLVFKERLAKTMVPLLSLQTLGAGFLSHSQGHFSIECLEFKDRCTNLI